MADIKKIMTTEAANIKAVFGTAKADIKKVGSGGTFAATAVATSFDNWDDFRESEISLSSTGVSFSYGSLSNWFDGAFTGDGTDSAIIGSTAAAWASGDHWTVDMGSSVVVQAVKIWLASLSNADCSSGGGVWGADQSQTGTLYGSDASDFSSKTELVDDVEWRFGGRVSAGGDVTTGDTCVNLGGSGTGGEPPPKWFWYRVYSFNTGATAYRYYRFEHKSVGSGGNSSYWYTTEFEFKIQAAA